ncbi:Oligosaccharyltransferase subunit Ribophorin II-domain-containing protein [Naematelia encephala]|uniref:Oligosaccharyltransferase subunit Ribophorin II-domain-containing protein n=1 Tax=Naematelia encephala TaxID=71784 RepID=A0A1Y2AMB2_9TREE|nr:Oligosaccharyltransferase subunit Ribophorin II-domain-containing protein [Naematelia encephala]
MRLVTPATLLTVLSGLLAVPSVLAGELGIKQGKISITSPNGLNDATYPLKEPTPLSFPITLTDDSTLKLSFSVVDTSSGEGVFPQQAHLLFHDPKGDDVTLPIALKSNGKASFTINGAKIPTSLAQTHGTLHLTLLLSSLSAHDPLLYPLGTLILPPTSLRLPPRKRHDLPPRAGEPAFKPEQELFHTFRQDEKTVGFVKSALGTGLVLSPWAVLAALFGKVSGELDFKSPPLSSWLFLSSLAALEALILTYWVALKLYHLLAVLIPLSLASAYAGKIALGSLREKRLKAGGAP